jgi:hypothetical protein
MYLLAAVVASTLSGLAATLLLLAISGDLGNPLLTVYLLFAAVYALASVVIIGLPTHLVLKRCRKIALWPYLVPGSVVPAVVVVMMLHPFGEDGAFGIAMQAALMAVIGCVVASTFWAVAVRMRARHQSDMRNI